MTPSSATLAYRRASTQQASPVGLVIALCDTLAGDLTRAALALRAHNIQGRCDQLKHGFMVLQQLALLLDTRGETPAALQSQRFYDYLRGQMLTAQFKQDPLILEEAGKLLLEVRGAWQQVDSQAALAAGLDLLSESARASVLSGESRESRSHEEANAADIQRLPFHCSA